MDDKKLQTEFDEYFKGAALPENMTADAKAHVKPRKRDGLKWFLRLAPAAVASVLVIAVSVIVLNNALPSVANPGNGTSSGDPYTYYTAAGLNEKYLDPYSADSVNGLEFAQMLAYASNSNINLTAFYEGEKVKLAKAEISLINNGYRHDTVLYAEYTDEYDCFEELKEYLTGIDMYYRGYSYVYNLSYDEGENVYMIYTYTGGVKYYLSVMTSEPNGYKMYFDYLKNI